VKVRAHRQRDVACGESAGRDTRAFPTARSGLTSFIAGLARSTAEHNVTINNLLPGTFDTDP
jgi:NAD(P)-dependent dehydrogenase (short-subunit alcohol dehydrogenase family)